MLERGSGFVGVLVAVLSANAGCAAARMRVDPGVTTRSSEWEVEGANPRAWGAPLRFGPYRTASVPDPTTLGWSVPVLGATVAGSHTPYAWRMTGGAAQVDAECHQLGLEGRTAGAVEIGVRGASDHPVLACAFRLGGASDQARTWILALRAMGPAAPGFRGSLRDDRTGEEYEVASSHEIERPSVRLGTPAGFTVARGDDLVELVETLGAGRVWVERGARDLDALAAAAMALLLFRPPGA